jgi:hypothetical protein
MQMGDEQVLGPGFRWGMVRGEWELSDEFLLSESSPLLFHHGSRVV